MSFLNPIAFSLAALSGLIVLMYLLKLRRKREEFSSTLLWVRSVEDLIANAPFQRLRQNLLMYLQILFVLLLALALARPMLWMQRRGGASRIILIDNTASMCATDGERGATRLEEAKRQARRIIGNMRSGDEAMIVGFGGAARVAQPMTAEKSALYAAVERVEPTDAPVRIREALLLAQGIRKDRPGTGLTLISDGGVGYLGNLIGKDEPVEFIKVGAGDDNRAITAFDIRSSFERRDEAQVFAEVENFAARPAHVLVRCFVGGQLAQAKEADLPARGKQGFAFDGIKGTTESLVRVELAEPDLLASDNAAQGFLNLDASRKILLVSSGNFFLERMLALLPGARVARVAPALYQPTLAYDLVVFDQFSPPALGPGRYLFIDAQPPLPGFAKAPAKLPNQFVLDWNRLHPITRYLGLDGLAAGAALGLTAPDWMTPLVESAETPLVLAGSRQGVRLVCIAFDLYASDWPLQISFPIFFSNAVQWLAGGESGGTSGTGDAQHHTGETITLTASGEVQVKGPAAGGVQAGEWRLSPNEEQQAFFNQTLRAGVYEVALTEPKKTPPKAPPAGATPMGTSPGDKSSTATATAAMVLPATVLPAHFAVNLLSPAESDLTPKSELIAGEKKIAATAPTRENREVWRWIALAGLLLLAGEWHLYCRRSWL